MPGITLVRTPPLPKTAQPIVIIGAGGIVRDGHLPAYTKANFPVFGIFDIDEERARSLAEKFKVGRVFATLEAAAAEAHPDAVFDLAVPPMAILNVLPNLPDGRGVLIQKPLGENLEQARRIVDLCHRKNLHAAVNFQLRYAPYVLAARSLIEQGAIGELHDIEIRVTVYTPWHTWTFLQASPRLEILYHSIHYLDLVRFFLGEPRSVYAKTLKHPKLPQLASTRSDIILDYSDTVRACVFANHGHEFGLRHQESYIKWEGTRGAIVAKMGLLLNYPKGEPDKFEFCTLQDSGPPKWRTARLKGSWFPDGFIGTMASVMRYMEGSAGDLSPSVDDACKTMALVETAHRSSDGGGSPFVEFPG
jgi:predicted dehydrogenase